MTGTPTRPSTYPAHRGKVRSVPYRILLIFVGLALALPTASAHAQDEAQTNNDPLQASTLTVNVELILDASGSMAEQIPARNHNRAWMPPRPPCAR